MKIISLFATLLLALGVANAQNKYRVVDIEHHFGNRTMFDAWFLETQGCTLDELPEDQRALYYTTLNLGADRIAAMDSAGVDYAHLSLTTPGAEAYGPQMGKQIAQEANDSIAKAIAMYPDRIGGWMTLYPEDVNWSLEEIDRCKNMGLYGWACLSNMQGKRLDDPKYWPIFKKLEALGMPVYLQPTFSKDEAIAEFGYSVNGPALGFQADALTTFMRMVCRGLFDECPNLKIVLGHGGEGLPFFKNRINAAYRQGRDKTESFICEYQHEPSYYVDHNVWVTTSGNFSNEALRCCLDEMPEGHVIMSSDYPYENFAASVSFISNNQKLTDAEKKSILASNAMNLGFGYVPEVKRGDADLDNAITINDYNKVKTYILCSNQPANKESIEFLNADANENEEIEVSDLTTISNLIYENAANKLQGLGLNGQDRNANVPWVQLWENGPRWATYNVGATSPTEYGKYSSWENANKPSSWGSQWILPSKEDYDKLLSECTIEWSNNYQGSGVNGLVCTGKGNYASNSIFLPAAGYLVDGTKFNDVGGSGNFWTSTSNGEIQKFYFGTRENERGTYSTSSNNFGLSVRAVLPVSKITFAANSLNTYTLDTTEVKVNLNMADSISSLQMNITLPAGVQLVSVANNVQLGNMANNATLFVKQYPGTNMYNIQILTNNNTAFMSDSAQILSFKIMAPNSVQEEAIHITNIIGSTTNAEIVTLADANIVFSAKECEAKIDSISTDRKYIYTLTEAQELITVSAKTTGKINAMQFTVNVPENVTIVVDSTTKGSILSDAFNVRVNKNTQGTYTFVITTNGTACFNNNTDACDVVTFRVMASKATTGSIAISNVLASTYSAEPKLIYAEGTTLNYRAKMLQRGDADLDKDITVNDYNYALHYTLSMMPMPAVYTKEFLSADANADSVIDVTDCQTIALLINGEKMDNAKSFFGAAQVVEGLRFVKNGNEISIVADNASKFLGLQMDITLPKGVTVMSKKSDTNHTVSSNIVNGATRLLVTSLSNNTFADNTLVTIILSEDADVVASNIIFANTNYQSIKAEMGTVTDVKNANVDVNANNGKYIKNGNIVIVKNGKQYNVNGQIR